MTWTRRKVKNKFRTERDKRSAEAAKDPQLQAVGVGGKKAEHRPRNHDKRHRSLATHDRPRQGCVTMSYLCPHCSGFPMEDYVWWSLGDTKHTNWWCAICGEKYDWKQLVVQTGESEPGQGLQSACSNSWLLRKSDSCVEVAGEQTRRWRQPHTELRDGPL